MPEQLPSLPTLWQLPALPTRLIGREHELGQVRSRLRDPTVRLVPVTGPGGSGKSRLAIEAAGQLEDVFVDGVAFVDLAPVADPALVISAIARALGVHDSGRQSLLESLRLWLAERRALLVLDNFEHLLEAGRVVDDLLAACPRLTLLITTRAALRVPLKDELVLAPLPVATATELFLERARAGLPTFALDADNAPAIAELCRRLDGLPLAIELAAARLKDVDLATLLMHLETSLEVLSLGPAELPARQRTLSATILWSYGLLVGDEQRLLRCLGGFPGGFGFASLEAVWSRMQPPGARTRELFAALIEHSLVGSSTAVPRSAAIDCWIRSGRSRASSWSRPGSWRRSSAHTRRISSSSPSAPRLSSKARACLTRRQCSRVSTAI